MAAMIVTMVKTSSSFYLHPSSISIHPQKRILLPRWVSFSSSFEKKYDRNNGCKSLTCQTTNHPMKSHSPFHNSHSFFLKKKDNQERFFPIHHNHNQCKGARRTQYSFLTILAQSLEPNLNEEKPLVHVMRFDGVISTTFPFKAGAGILLYNAHSGQEVSSICQYLGPFNLTSSKNSAAAAAAAAAAAPPSPPPSPSPPSPSPPPPSPLIQTNDGVRSSPSPSPLPIMELSSKKDISDSMRVHGIIAQGKSLLLGMKHAKEMGMKSLVVQGHSPLIYYHLKRSSKDSNNETVEDDANWKAMNNNDKLNTFNQDITNIYQQIQKAMLNFASFQMIYIPKGRNKKAVEMAENAISTNDSIISAGASDSQNHDIFAKEVTSPSMLTASSVSSTSSTDDGIRSQAVKTKNPIDPNQTYILQFDGGARGNPGIAGAGFVLYSSNESTNNIAKEIYAGSYYLGTSFTNNEAEYTALKQGLECCQKLGIQYIEAQGDSNLVVKQVMGTWKCRKDHLKVFLKDINTSKNQFQSFRIEHIPRKANSRADQLANLAMDTKKNSNTF